MARILIAWELGGDFGHVGQLLPLADGLRAAGHSVFLALKHAPAGMPLIARAGFAYFSAPQVWDGTPDQIGRVFSGQPQPLENYADILRMAGWMDVPALGKAITAWRSIFQLACPDLLVCHSAPTAQLASWGLDIRTCRVGSGFDCPPVETPLPPMRYWQKPGQRAMEERESELLGCVQEALTIVASTPLSIKRLHLPQSVAEVLRPGTDFLATLPALDHYHRRQVGAPRDVEQLRQSEHVPTLALAGETEGHPAEPSDAKASEPRNGYFGPLLTLSGGLEPVWPTGSGPRLLAYLRPPFTAAVDLLQTLREGPWRTLLVIPGWAREEAKALSTRQLSVATAPVHFQRALAQCEGVISHGGHGTVAASLLAGKPVLNLPKHLEQLLVSRHAAQSGAGIIVSSEAAGQNMAAAINQLLDAPALISSAQRLATRHADLQGDRPCASLTSAITHFAR